MSATKTVKVARTVKKTVKTVKVSAYKKQVLDTNKALKTTHKTLGGCLKNMWFFRDDMALTNAQISVIRLLRDDKKGKLAYNEFKKVVRTSKSGNYSPFYVLQAMYKASKVENTTKKTKK